MKDAMTDHKAEPMRGRLIEADFGKDTVTFRMEPPYYVASGEFLIAPIGGGISLDSLTAAPAASEGEDGRGLAHHCQNGRADVCRASQRDGVVCPDDSCDIDDGVREKDAPAAQVAATPKHDEGREAAEFVPVMEAWRAAISGERKTFDANLAARQHPEILSGCPTCGATQPAARRVTELEVSAAADRLVLKWNLHGPDAYRMANDALNAAAESFAQPAEGVSGG